MNALIPWTDCMQFLWLKEDWTNDKWKGESLNFRFYWANRTRTVYGCRIAVTVSRRCTVCLVLDDVGVVESLRLSYLLVCGDSASRRWLWSLCLMQIVDVAVWSRCRCCCRRSMMWMHCLLRLGDRCPVFFFNPWLTECVHAASSVGASPSSALLVD